MKIIQINTSILILMLINISFLSVAQEHALIFPEKLNYEKVKITTLDWDEVKSPNLEFLPSENAVRYFNLQTNNQINLGLDKIHTIEYQKGSRALLWGAIGGVVGISVFSGLVDGISDDAITPVFFVCTGVGISLGTLIGSANKKYIKIYHNGKIVPSK